MTSKRGAFWVVLLVGVVVAVVLVGARREQRDDTPLSPRGTGGLGLRAVVELAQDYGADVEVVDGFAGDDATIALLADDQLGVDDGARLAAWVRRGGTLVVTDPTSRFAPDQAAPRPVLDRDVAPGRCDVDALRGVERLRLSQAFTLAIPPGSSSCFGDSVRAVVVVTPTGDGTVVSIGGPSPLVNANLAEGDNARLAVTLLAPRDGTRLDVVRGPSFGLGEETLWNLIRPGIKYGMLQLGLAVVVYSLFRARRLGRPVGEVPPVAIEGAELVDATGRLLSRTRSPDHAAALLRAEARRELAREVGAVGGAPGGDAPERLAVVVAARIAAAGGASDAESAATASRVAAALSDRPVVSDEQLLELARQLHALRQEVRGVRD
jgi:hypothetical protein